MKRFSIYLARLSGLVLCTLALAQQPIPKQLAGPPAEFAQMQPAPLVADGIRSKSALLPVHFKQGPGKWVWQAPFSVENPDDFQMVVFSGEADWRIRLRAPGMKRSMAIEDLYQEARDDWYGIEENKLPCRFYHFATEKTGQWYIEVETNTQPFNKDALEPNGFVMIASDNPYRLYAHQTQRQTLVGQPIGLAAFAYDKREFDAEAIPNPGSHQILSAKLHITTPSGLQFQWPMQDKGLEQDGKPNDGVYGRTFVPEEIGVYQAQITAKSVSADGVIFTRTTEHAISVIFPDLQLAAHEAFTKIDDSDRLQLIIPIDSFSEVAAKYRVFAEVWGRDVDGEPKPVAWVGGMSVIKDQALELGLDSRWIGISGAQAPFYLRNLSIEETETFIPLVQSTHLDLYVDRLPDAAFVEVKTISEEMLKGPRPKMTMQKASDSRLLLVHGYCSSNVWAGVSSQFSQASVFQDFNQNRSHDQFALLIHSFANTWNSYGIVAHSQGGAAALHLYTY